jgi:hypothetical protein
MVRARVVPFPTASSRSSRLGAVTERATYGSASGIVRAARGRAHGRRDPSQAPARFPPGADRSIQIPTTYSLN